MLGGSRPNPFCKCAIVGLGTIFYTVNSAWLGGSRIFQGVSTPPYGWLRGPAVEHWSLADVLSLSCARLVADG